MALQSLVSEGFVMSKFRFVASNSKSDKEREQEYRAYVGVATEIEKSQNSEHRQVRNEILRQQSSQAQAVLNSVKPLQLELAARSFSPVISDFQPTDINQVFSTKSALNHPYIKNILTEAEYADLVKRHEEYVQFQKDLDEALVLLGEDPKQPDDDWNNMDIVELLEHAEAQRNLNQILKSRTILPKQAFKILNHALHTSRTLRGTRENDAYTIGYERIYLLCTHSQKTAFNAMIEEEGIETLSVADYEDQFENFKSAMKYRNRKRK